MSLDYIELIDVEEAKSANKAEEAELSSAEGRAWRLKRIRNMAGLSRKELCQLENFNINTFKGWEIARHGGLPFNEAKRIVEQIGKYGVICSIEWLYEGKGSAPYTVPRDLLIQTASDDPKISKELILKEIKLFSQNCQDVIYCEIKDDGMRPFYEIGDFVAGRKKKEDQINDALIGKHCIIQLGNGNYIVRLVTASAVKGRFTLRCLNPATTVEAPVHYDVEINTIAPITRYYKLSE